MPTRKRVRPRPRTTVRVRRRRGARTKSRGAPMNRELREVLDTQVESGDELRKTNVPIATEPAFLFKA